MWVSSIYNLEQPPPKKIKPSPEKLNKEKVIILTDDETKTRENVKDKIFNELKNRTDIIDDDIKQRINDIEDALYNKHKEINDV